MRLPSVFLFFYRMLTDLLAVIVSCKNEKLFLLDFIR